MPTSAAGNSRAGWPPGRRCSGFTLIELLVALLIVALLASVAALALPRRNADATRREADRLAALLDTARQRALLGGQPLAWVASRSGYLFVRPGPQGWEVLSESPLQPRRWDWLGDGAPPAQPPRLAASSLTLDGGVQLELAGGLHEPQAGGNWLVFGSEPVQAPMQLDWRDDGVRVRLSSDGLQAFQVEVSR